MKNFFYQILNLKWAIFLTGLGLNITTLADSNQCTTIRFNCINTNCPIKSFKVETVNDQLFSSGKIQRTMGNRKLSLPYSISFSSNGDSGLVGSGNIAVHFNDGNDTLKSCALSIPFFSVVKKLNGIYNVSYNLPNQITSKIFIQDRQQSVETETESTSYLNRDTHIGTQNRNRDNFLEVDRGYSATDSNKRRQTIKDSKQFQEALCPSHDDRFNEVSLNLEYRAVASKECNLDTVIPTTFQYDSM